MLEGNDIRESASTSDIQKAGQTKTHRHTDWWVHMPNEIVNKHSYIESLQIEKYQKLWGWQTEFHITKIFVCSCLVTYTRAMDKKERFYI